MPTIAFEADDYCADQTFVRARYRFLGDEAGGWRVERDGKLALELGPGYRALRVRQCGVCSTDLARHQLPFRLPQVIGHEVVALGVDGTRYVVEINASHVARRVVHDCAFCRAGLATHCPERLVLGIHDLPGGFGPWVLAPIDACVPVPTNVPDAAAVLVEPFAAALHAAHTIAPRPGDRVAVLGPRRLGMLVVAALVGLRTRMRQRGADCTVAAVVRDPGLSALATTFGADETFVLEGTGARLEGTFDVVVDTTGNPDGLATAVRLARREVHLKSTHGQRSCGLRHLTAMVVDELGFAPFPRTPPVGEAAWDRLRTGPRPRIAWLANASPPAWLLARADVQCGDVFSLREHFAAATEGLPRADVAVVDSTLAADAAVRPCAGDERSLVRPRGSILVHPTATVTDSPLLQAVVGRGLVLSTSRCGEFRRALELLAADPELARIGERLVTHRFPASRLAEAFTTARSRSCIKAVIEQATG